jgi:hypothetical protein
VIKFLALTTWSLRAGFAECGGLAPCSDLVPPPSTQR